MKERIQELVEQATVATDQELRRLSQGIEGMPSRLDLFNQKFAELIVRECADWINENVGMIDEDARVDLMKHFGVD